MPQATKIIEDFGERLEGARKNSFHGLQPHEVGNNDLDEYFESKGWTKDNLLGKADYRKLVESGRPRDLCYLIKSVRDALPSRPRIERIKPERRAFYCQLYLELLTQLKEMFENAKGADDLVRLDLKFIPEMTTIVNGRKYLTERASEVCHALGGNKGFLAIQIYEDRLAKIREYLSKCKWPEDGSGVIHRAPELKRPIKSNPSRTTCDYRQGRDATVEDFTNFFGFRAGEFGNWTSGKDRQHFLNQLYDSLCDLAAVLKLQPRAMSLGGSLAIAYGSRGRPGSAAHYEKGLKLLHFTKESWLGSIAHEWGHALDHYLCKQHVSTAKCLIQGWERYASEVYFGDLPNGYLRPLAAAYAHWARLVDLNATADSSKSMLRRAFECDAGRPHQYWSSHCEMFARTFESCISKKLEPLESDWLVSGTDNSNYQGKKPYPEEWLIPRLAKWFDGEFCPAIQPLLAFTAQCADVAVQRIEAPKPPKVVETPSPAAPAAETIAPVAERSVKAEQLRLFT